MREGYGLSEKFPTPMQAENTEPTSKRGYRRAFERIPDLPGKVAEFDRWLKAVEEWLMWIEENIPDNTYISRREAIEDFHMTSRGLMMLEKLGVDIYPDGRDVRRTEYDVKKLLRAVVAMPTIARVTVKRLSLKSGEISDVFRQVIDDTLNGRLAIDEIHKGEDEGQLE